MALVLWVVLAGALTGCAEPKAGRTQPAEPTIAMQPTPLASQTTTPTSPTPPGATATGLPAPASATPTRPVPTPSATRPPADACLSLPAANGRPAYRFNVVAEPVAHRLQVQQQLALADPARLATGEVIFNVPAGHTPGVFVLARARLAGAEGTLPAQLSGTTLRVTLPEAGRRGAAVMLCLDYALNLPAAGGEGLSAVHALGWSDLGLIAGYWHPVVAPYERARGWQTTPYHPVGDPILYEAADYEVVVRAPAGYSVIAAGAVEAGQGYWRFRLEQARGFAFAVTDVLVPSITEANGLPVTVYHQKAHAQAAADVLRAAREALPLFAQTYGPYPYSSLTIVEAMQFGGMEYSGLITFSSQAFAAYQPPAPGTEFGADFLIQFVVHEIAHQWWYAAVGNDQAYEPWLDEALARFSERLYYERLHPAYVEWWGSGSVNMATVPINRPIYDFADTVSYVQAVYVSGARFLLAIRQALGDQAFFAFLQDYYYQYRGRLATQAEFLALLRAHAGPAPDKLLSAYFDPAP